MDASGKSDNLRTLFKLNELSEFCWNINRCEFCERNRGFHSPCRLKEEFKAAYLTNRNAKCDHYDLSFSYIKDLIVKGRK